MNPLVTRLGAGIFTLDAFLTPEECRDFIAASETEGYSEAVVNINERSVILKDVRNNDRILYDDTALAERLFRRAAPFLPPVLEEWTLAGLNERFRFYRYTPLQYFKWHKDGAFVRSADEQSLLTLLIYLNDGFEGGETEFSRDRVKPETGRALVFPHPYRHQGLPVISGVKYVLRTDVMYRRG